MRVSVAAGQQDVVRVVLPILHMHKLGLTLGKKEQGDAELGCMALEPCGCWHWNPLTGPTMTVLRNKSGALP